MIGQQISHFRVVDFIAASAMSTVYKAEDTILHRFVVLKFVKQHLIKQYNDRFLREAKAISSLEHPNICTIFEVGTGPDQQPFIAMPYYRGETLEERLAIGRLQVDETLKYAIQLVEGLRHAHKAGIVHRDIKPSNIFITSAEHVKLLDFGLALIKDMTRLTMSDQILGTPSYMSPEQIRGDEINASTDIWSTGALLYEMLTGRPPFRSGSGEGLQSSILNDLPTPLLTVRPDLPEGLGQIVDRCLCKAPAARFPTAEDLLLSLRSLMASAPPSAVPKSSSPSNCVGIVAPISYWSTDYYVEIIRGIRAAANREKPDLQKRFVVMDVSKESFEEVGETITDSLLRNLDGVILINMRLSDRLRKEFNNLGVPVVLVNHEDRKPPSVCSVLHNLDGFSDLLQHSIGDQVTDCAVLITKPVANPFKGVRIDQHRKEKK
jgi:serine/threonine protein kinase